MKSALIISGVIAALSLGGCATAGYDSSGRYTSACRADYDNNRTAATVGGDAVGAAAGAAIARGGAAGAIIGNQVAKRDNPCGDRRGFRDDRRY